MLLASGEKDRVEPRVRRMVKATMRDSRGMRDVALIDISTRGLLATSASPPEKGAIVELQVGRNIMVGQVRWTAGRRFGMVLQDRVSVAALLEGGTKNARLKKTTSRIARQTAGHSAVQRAPAVLSNLSRWLLFSIVLLGATNVMMNISTNGLTFLGNAIATANAAKGG